MKREILFRGKSPKGHWIYGMPSYDLKYIFNDSNYDSYDQFEIIPETIGQFTGLTDKNGAKIFEEDIIGRIGFFSRIVAHDGIRFYTYSLHNLEQKYPLTAQSFDEYDEIIGNIHDNPELIKS